MQFHFVCDKFIYNAGIPKVLFYHIKSLQQSGHKVKIWTSQFNYPWFDVDYEIVSLGSLWLNPITTHLRYIRVPEDDIVVSHGAILGNHFLQCKRFYFVNYGYRPFTTHWKSIHDLVALFAQVFRARKVISISEYCRRQLLRTFGRNSVIVYPGVDVDLFRPTGADKEYDLCSLARSNKKAKNEDLLKTAFPSTRFVSNVTDEQLAAFYNRGRIYVSLSPWEGFGLSLAESMSCGVPVIALNKAAMPEVVNDGGMVCESLSQVRQAVATVLDDSALYERLARQGRTHVIQNFDYRIKTEEFVAFLLESEDSQ